MELKTPLRNFIELAKSSDHMTNRIAYEVKSIKWSCITMTPKQHDPNSDGKRGPTKPYIIHYRNLSVVWNADQQNIATCAHVGQWTKKQFNYIFEFGTKR